MTHILDSTAQVEPAMRSDMPELFRLAP